MVNMPDIPGSRWEYSLLVDKFVDGRRVFVAHLLEIPNNAWENYVDEYGYA